MDFHDLLARPMQVVKEILDLESDLESPSLASQFVAIKHQLDEVQARLRESNRISHEKDIVIARLQQAMVAKAQKALAGPSPARRQEPSAPTPPVGTPEHPDTLEPPASVVRRSYAPPQTCPPPPEANEDVKLPLVSRCPAAVQVIASGPEGQAETPKPAKPATTRKRAARKSRSETPARAKPRQAAKADAPTAPKAKATRARTATRKTTAKAKSTTTTTTARTKPTPRPKAS